MPDERGEREGETRMKTNGWFLALFVLLCGFFGALLYGIVQGGEQDPATGSTPVAGRKNLLQEQRDSIPPRHGTSMIGEQAVFVLRGPGTPSGTTIACPSRDFLAGYIAGRSELLMPMLPILRVEQPCGRATNFETLHDLPTKTFACPCGKKTCLLIAYTEAS